MENFSANVFARQDLLSLKEILSDDEYVILCHGTTMKTEEIRNKIMQNGLYATGYSENSSLFKTTNPIDVNCSIEELKSKLDNWPHSSNNIVFLKLPKKYFNIYTSDNSDLDCQKTRAFTTKITMEDGRYKYIVDPKFIVGAYNLNSESVMFNPNYEKQLSPETILVLEERLINVQKEMKIIDDVETEQKKDYKYYYEELMKAVKKRNTMQNATEEEKKQITGEIFYNQGYLIKNLNSEEEFREITTSIINDLNGNDLDIKLQNIILEDMQDRLNKINNKSNNENINDTEETEKLDFNIFISQIKEQTGELSNEYKNMLSDGYIDDDELETLINKIDELNDNAILLKTMVNDEKEKIILDSIIELINQEKNKMMFMQNGIKEINNGFGR